MTETVDKTDVFAVAVPEGVDHTSPEVLTFLNELVTEWIHKQYLNYRKPNSITNITAEWLITDQIAEVDTFQPAHDCAACLAGNDQSKAYLSMNPGRFIAMANLNYTEVWDD